MFGGHDISSTQRREQLSRDLVVNVAYGAATRIRNRLNHGNHHLGTMVSTYGKMLDQSYQERTIPGLQLSFSSEMVRDLYC